ncbi:TetR family transcriptional regulator [Nesterenkonia flava]|uniref:TetR family transcriptional regulator n=1 Tax=Nesterenkonia flava TaxID=469799 RepID=A0ABU1FUD8_9MICC|nr:TetR family transcriptional regulator [Nesterenkonia flava]MDR5711798.1 TetR family transcriptional regulator [Nesterenkonia flava]
MTYQYGRSRGAGLRGSGPGSHRAPDGQADGHSTQDAASTHNVTGTGNTSPPASAKERILTAAIDLYGRLGFDGVTVKEIAQAASVSAPLVIHHFGSKAGLRAACDAYVAEQFRRTKTESVRRGNLPRNVAHEAMAANRHLVKYLMRAFMEGGETIDAFFDQLVEDSLVYTSEAEEIGLVYPSRNPRHRAVVMLLQSFGSLILHRQLERHLGVSLLDDEPNPEGLDAYMATVLELYTQPVMNAEAFAELLAADAEAHTEATEPGSTQDRSPRS